jgi:predicted oxidoreductase
LGENLVDTGRRAIGRAGLSSGPLAFGCWRFSHDDLGYAADLIEHALSAGLDLIDTADIYGAHFGGAEELLGRVLAHRPALRDQMLLATKGGISPGVPYDSGASYLRAACEASLRRLGVERVQLYQIHRPDFFAHPAEVAETLLVLKEEGKLEEIGVSNYTGSQYDALVAALGEGVLATSQPEFSAVALGPIRDGMLDRCCRDGVTPLSWSPLAGGRIVTGEGVPPRLLQVLDELAEREGTSRAAIALSFVLAHPSRPVAIIGTQRVERIDQALEALKVSLDRSDCYRIIEASEQVPLP